MSEILKPSNEHSGEVIDTSEAQKENLKNAQEKAEATKEISKETVDKIRHTVEEKAISGKEISVGDKSESSHAPVSITKKEKYTAYKKTIKKIRQGLPLPERTLSKLVHQPVIEKLSDVGTKTIARPSGFLTGSFIALIGSIVLVYFARRNGFSYNYLTLFILFAGGYLVGIVLELTMRLVRPSKHRQ